MSTSAAIETRGLSKSYGGTFAVKGLSLSVKPHGITAFLGMNGSGKSTTIKMLLGMIQPSSGYGAVLGHNIHDAAECLHARKRIAYIGENKCLYDYMSVEQMIRFTRAFYPDWRKDSEHTLLAQYKLPLDRKVKSLSKGMRTKLRLLLAFARRPDLLILDEPSDGLDPVGMEALLESLVAHCSEGTTVFFSSHHIPDVERIADHVCMLHKGALVLNAPMDELRRSYRRITFTLPVPRIETEFHVGGNIESIQRRGYQLGMIVNGNAETIISRARNAGASAIDVAPLCLRDIFLQKAMED